MFLKLYKQLVRPHLEYATCVWNPHFKTNITRLEQVQKRAKKSFYGLEKLSYEEQLRSLNLKSLYRTRLISNLVCVYKLFHKQRRAVLTHNNFFAINTNRNRTRGHNYKLQKPYARLDCRKYCFWSQSD